MESINGRLVYLSFLCLTLVVIGIWDPMSASAQSRSDRGQRAGNYGDLTPRQRQRLSYINQVNNGRVGVISGGISGTYIRIATDLATVLDDDATHTLRVLPIAGKGGVSNITDLLYLRGIDIGIVQSDILNYIEANGIHRNVRNKIHYITKLYNAEFHIVTRKDIRNIQELQGKTVNFWHKGSATDITGSTVFDALNIKVNRVYLDQELGIEKVKKGEIAANMLLVGKPGGLFGKILPEAGLHLLPVPFTGKIAKIYLPARFENKDYPGLVPEGGAVSTIASGAVLAVYNWPKKTHRYERVSRFVEVLFANFDKFLVPPRHAKWKEVNLATNLPGWNRFGPAAAWLERNQLSVAATTPEGQKRLQRVFNQFLDRNRVNSGSGDVGSSEREELFKQFMKWRRGNSQ